MFSAFHRTKLISFSTRLYINTSAVRSIVDPLTYASSNKIEKKKAFIEEFADNLINMRGKSMDIGCGPGDVTKHFLLPAVDSNAVLIGTDISENMIEYAQRTYGVKKRLEFEVLDIQTKKLPQKYVSEFDHVFSIYTLQWCNDIRQAFENIYRMLRPDGTMLVIFIASHDICKVLENMIQDDRFASYIPKCIFPYQNSANPHKELKELLQKLGYMVTHCSLRDMYYSYENIDQFSSCLLSILGFLDKMPRDLEEEFKKCFVRYLCEEKKIVYKQDEIQKTHVLDLHNVLIAFAEKRVPQLYT